MKLPLTWLKEFIDYEVSEEVLAKKLTDAGIEVEETTQDAHGKTVLGLNVTPNRGDALSILGLARETSAVLGGKKALKKKTRPLGFAKNKKRAGDSQDSIQVSLSASLRCARYRVALLKGVKVGPSPEWMKHRLDQMGIRSINNIVDITNYILMGYGQPLHAFDARKIRGSRIDVRTAKSGEKIRTLDHVERSLEPSDLVIADAEGPIALAGIMGGEGSEITAETRDVALEYAWFEPAGIRKTARRLGLQTDSSYRFERGVDFNGEDAFSEAVHWIQELSHGKLTGSVADFCPRPFRPGKIFFHPSRVAQVLGGVWKPAEFRKIFVSLGCRVQESKKDLWMVTVPSWRGDISREEDLFEEIVRLSGLDRIPATFPPMTTTPLTGNRHERLRQERDVRELLTALEFFEAIHFSFISPEEALALDPGCEGQLISIDNPLGHEFSVMRPSLLPSLLKTLQYHHRHKISRVRLFELRNRFLKTQDGILERKALATVLSGTKAQGDWRDKSPSVDFFEVKGLIEKIVKKTNRSVFIRPGKESVPFLHPGKQSHIFFKNQKDTLLDLGVLGELHPEIALKMDFKEPVYLFELDWEGLMELAPLDRVYRPYSDQPLVSRDLALLMDAFQPAGDLIDLLKAQDPTIQRVKIFDVYEGEKLPLGKKSVAYSLELGFENKTMTEEEINQVMQKLMNYLKNSLGIEIR